MLRAKATEKEFAGRQIGAAAVAAALGLDEMPAAAPGPSLPPDEPKPPSSIEALVQELAKAVAGRDLAERKAVIAQARSAFEASRRSAMPPPGESLVLADLKAFDDAAAKVIADPPQPVAAAPAEAIPPVPPAVIPLGEALPGAPAISADAPKNEEPDPAAVSGSDRKNGGTAKRAPLPRVLHRALPASLRIALRVLIAAWLGLGAVLGYAYLRHPARTTSSTVVQPAPAAVPPAPSPNPGKPLPAPNPLVPME